MNERPDRLPHQVLDEVVASNPRVAARRRTTRRARRALAWRNPSTPWWRTYTRLRPPEFLANAAIVLGCCLLLVVLTGQLSPGRAARLLLLVYIPGAFLALAVTCLGLIVHALVAALTARRTLRTATEHALHDRRQLRELLATLGIHDPATLATVLRLAAAAPQNTPERRGRLLHLALLADPSGRYAPVYLPDQDPEDTSSEGEKVADHPEEQHEPPGEDEDQEPVADDGRIPVARTTLDDEPTPASAPPVTDRYPE